MAGRKFVLEISFQSPKELPQMTRGKKWNFYQFTNKNRDYYADPGQFLTTSSTGELIGVDGGVREKIRAGLAYWLRRINPTSLFDKNQTQYVSARHQAIAGILIWEGEDRPREIDLHERERSSSEFLIRLNRWLSGECLAYKLKLNKQVKAEGEGFFGVAELARDVARHVGKEDRVETTGAWKRVGGGLVELVLKEIFERRAAAESLNLKDLLSQ